MGILAYVRNSLARLCARRYPTMFGTARVYEIAWESGRLRVLDVCGTYQSATYLDDRWCEAPFPYLARYEAIFEATHPAHDVCMLGGGGYAFPKHLIAHYPEARIDVVEIDPAITHIAQEHFFLDRLIQTYHTNESGRLRNYTTDALSHLRQCAQDGRRYDAILNDCFAGEEPENAFMLPSGIDLIATCLTPSGMYLTNVITALEGTYSEPLQNAIALLSETFSHVCALVTSGHSVHTPDNVLVVASNANLELTNAVRLFDAS